MLPDAFHLPSFGGQLAVNQPVPLNIAVYFFFPEMRVCCRSLIMSGAAMPETAVDENDNPLPRENYIRPARKLNADPVTVTQ